MSQPRTCARCGRDHGCGAQPWKKVPGWVWLCDDCMSDRAETPLSTEERIIIAMRRMPFRCDGPRQIAGMAGLAESTVRRHLRTLHGTRPLDRYGWWTLTSDGLDHADRIVGVESNRITPDFGGHTKIETEVAA